MHLKRLRKLYKQTETKKLSPRNHSLYLAAALLLIQDSPNRRVDRSWKQINTQLLACLRTNRSQTAQVLTDRKINSTLTPRLSSRVPTKHLTASTHLLSFPAKTKFKVQGSIKVLRVVQTPSSFWRFKRRQARTNRLSVRWISYLPTSQGWNRTLKAAEILRSSTIRWPNKKQRHGFKTFSSAEARRRKHKSSSVRKSTTAKRLRCFEAWRNQTNLKSNQKVLRKTFVARSRTW
jgi:hypothetical protein